MMQRLSGATTNKIDIELPNGHIWIDFSSVTAIQWQFSQTDRYIVKVWVVNNSTPFISTLTREALVKLLSATGLPQLRDDE